MQSVNSPFTLEETIKKSRFIALLSPCFNELDVANRLEECKYAHPNASHVVFAYRIKSGTGYLRRFNDDGEPSGTAGKPIFQHLEGKELVNVLLIVIRYFGGIKLGAGGLTRAYGSAAKKVIEIAELYSYVEFVEQTLEIEYKLIQTFEYDLIKWGGSISEQTFSDKIGLKIQLPKDQLLPFSKAYGQYLTGQV